MNELKLSLTVAVDHDLDVDGAAELLDILKEHLESLYEEPGPQQSYFSNIQLSPDQAEYS